MMESEIFKFICSNQGSVNTDDLLFNLGLGASVVSEITGNSDKFVSCCPFGQPKVVVRTRLRLCRARDCQGTCRGLHLCMKFLFSGSCQFSQLRRRCNFSHDLDTDHNQRVLREHELENLSRTELCMLLMQSDDRLLPPICHDYNNGGAGGFGLCQEGYDCKRLHVCERYLNRDCFCFRTHDFNAQQPLTILLDKGIPDDLMRSLKTVYANILALKYSNRRANPQPRGGNSGNRGTRGNRGYRGGGGNRGNRGNRGNQGRGQHVQQTSSTSDIRVDIDTLDLYSADGYAEGSDQQQWKSSTSDISIAASDTDTSSVDGQTKKRRHRNKTPARGRGGHRGGRGSHQPQQTGSVNELLVNFDGLDLYSGAGPTDISAAAAAASGVRGRGGHRGGGGNHQQLPRTRSSDDITAAENKEAKSDEGPNRRERPRPVRDKTEICMFFIKGHCIHEERCFKAHDKMPYRWEMRENDQWTAMPDSEAIEKDYCDPANTYSSSSPLVNFDTMTCGQNKVRRLSTLNSVVEPTYIHTTEWLWYWEDEFGKWTMYASSDGGHKAADMDSTTLEQKFVANDKDVVEFSAGSQSYSLSFQDMIQTNKHYGTKRVVKRRPRFASAADVQARKMRKPLGHFNIAAVPDHWDKTQIPKTGCGRVALLRSSDEFKEIETLFCKTMTGFDIVKIERIQNKALWDSYQLQKNQLREKKGGRIVTEKQLFHGTNDKHVDDICNDNLDWRLCGTNGTVYGKGSYFARDAKYSHSYTSDSDVKSMFVARVLVGRYTRGCSEYVRPPPKDGEDSTYYNSCVNDVMNPSIFVVFEKQQIYPEYLLQYKATHPLVSSYGAASVPTAKPAVQPKPAPAPRPASQTSLSGITVYRPSSSSSYQSSASFYQPSTPSYQPSTPVHRSSTPSYHYPPTQPPTRSPPPPKKQSDSCVIA